MALANFENLLIEIGEVLRDGFEIGGVGLRFVGAHEIEVGRVGATLNV